MIPSIENKPKSFWSRPEGTTGMLVLAGAGVGLYFALPTLLIFMTGLMALLGKTIAVVVLSAVLGALLFILTNKKFLTLMNFMFKSAMRKLTGWFIEIDPIGIMKSYIEKMQERREVVATTRDRLRGQIKVLDEKIQKGQKQYEKSMSMAQLAKERGNNGVLTVESRQAMRVEQLNNETYIPLKMQMEAHLRAANKYYEVTGTVIEDLKNEVQAQSDRREMIMASHSMMKAAKAILHGGTDEREMFDQALEFVVTDYGMKLAEVESFIENSKPFVDSLDMQNGVFEAEALKRLQEWENKADSILLGDSKRIMIEQSAANSPLNFSVNVPSVSAVDYNSLIAGKK
jgi:hypothetical protein